jgi:hypothetical protein
VLHSHFACICFIVLKKVFVGSNVGIGGHGSIDDMRVVGLKTKSDRNLVQKKWECPSLKAFCFGHTRL